MPLLERTEEARAGPTASGEVVRNLAPVSGATPTVCLQPRVYRGAVGTIGEEDSVRYGVSLPNFGGETDARTMAELAREAEQAGWDGFFV